MAHRRLTGPTDRIVIVGAGLGGLSAALRLTGAGRSVQVLEATDGPGGLMGRWASDGYTFDTGPSVLTMPSLIDDALACVGESRSDWLELTRLDPSYRASFADGTVLRSHADVEQMSEEIARVCGPDQVAGYRALIEYLEALYRAEFDTYMDRNLDSLSDLVRPEAFSLLKLGALGGLQATVARFVTDERIRRLFTFQAMYAGLAPAQARALYGVIAYLDSVAGVWFPRGGMYQVAVALAGAAAKHGAQFRYRTRVRRVEVNGDRATAVITDAGERIEADVVVLNTDLRHAYDTLLPADLAPHGLSRVRHSPSAFVWHVGSSGALPVPAHHTISFGAGWEQSFDEIINRGRLMSDPSMLITSASHTDAGLVPSGRHSYYVLVPCPNTQTASIDWARVGPAYLDEVRRVLAARGFDDHGAFSTGVEVQRVVTPQDWAAQGLAAGSPFALAHTVRQTGPLRHSTQHPGVPNLLFCGAGVQPGVGVPTVLLSGRLAASRVIEAP